MLRFKTHPGFHDLFLNYSHDTGDIYKTATLEISMNMVTTIIDSECVYKNEHNK